MLPSFLKRFSYFMNLWRCLWSFSVDIIHPKLFVIFRTDLHKMKIKHWIIGEYATKRCFFDLKKADHRYWKPSMFFPSFLNRFSYFMNLWWCLWSFSVDLFNICHLAPGNSKLLSMSSVKRPYLRGKQTQILRGQQRGNGSAKMISMAMIIVIIRRK
jgi:hypothetical protein